MSQICDGIVKIEPSDPVAASGDGLPPAAPSPFHVPPPSQSPKIPNRSPSAVLVLDNLDLSNPNLTLNITQTTTKSSSASAPVKRGRKRLSTKKVRKSPQPPPPPPKKSKLNCTQNYAMVSCAICGKEYASKGILERHHNWHRPSTTNCIKCEYCPFPMYFSNNKHLKIHIKEVHPSICKALRQQELDNRQCKLCAFFIKHVGRGQTMEEHMELHESNANSFECHLCQLYFPSAKQLKEHKQFKHQVSRSERNSTMQSCVVCRQVFQESKLRYHVLVHVKGKKEYKCELCEYDWYFRFPKNLREHKNQYHKGYTKKQTTEVSNGTQTCMICFLPYETGLQNHMKCHTRTDRRNLQCTLCDFGMYFLTKAQLTEHQKKAHDINPALKVCEICDLVIASSKHNDRHTKSAQRSEPCPICPQTWFTKYSIRAHVINNHEQTALQLITPAPARKPDLQTCSVCDLEFTMSELQAHKSVHLKGDKTYKCELCDCDWYFAEENQLKYHRRRYHSAKSSKSCGKLTKSRAYLLKACEICGLHYVPPADHLQRHTRTSTRSEPCHICPQTWFTKDTIRSHVLNTHGEAQLEDYERSRMCPVCHLEQNTVQHMKCHVKTPSLSWRCPMCPTTWFRSKLVRSHHWRTHHRSEDMSMNDSELFEMEPDQAAADPIDIGNIDAAHVKTEPVPID